MKKICLIAPKFLNYIGGMETHAFAFAKEFLNDKEFQIEVILTKNGVTDGICVPMNDKSKTIEDLAQHPLQKVKEVLTGDLANDAGVIYQITNPTETIYFINSPTWLPSLIQIKQEYPSAKIILRSGGNDIIAGWIGDENNKITPLEETRTMLVDSINKYVDYLIVNSDYSKERMINVGIKQEKIQLVSGGVDCTDFFPNHITGNSPYTSLLTVARLVPFKGIEDSIRAVKLASKHHKIKYRILGDGPERDKLENLVNDLGLGRVVEFLGAKNIERVAPYYRESEIYLHMPIEQVRHERGGSFIHTETMGRCYCEAAASGLPSIGTKVGGVQEMIQEGTTGFLVNESDYIAAAKRVCELINNTDLRTRMGRAAREYAQAHLNWDKVFTRYRKLFAD